MLFSSLYATEKTGHTSDYQQRSNNITNSAY